MNDMVPSNDKQSAQHVLTVAERTQVTTASVDLRSMSPFEQAAQRAMAELARWCFDNEPLLTQGRSIGFRMAVSPAMKDVITMVAADREQGMRINANLIDLPS